MPDAAAKTADRLVSLDAYRGFVMLAMASGGLGLRTVATHFPDSQAWDLLSRNSEHVRWTGWSIWDLIQPCFMFIVGVAMPFSYARRRAAGARWPNLLGHAIRRSLVLVALGVFLASAWDEPRTNFVFTNVLAQIGLGYTFVFLLLGRKPWVQVLAAALILVADWLAFALWPVGDLRALGPARGLGPNSEILSGFHAHWQMNLNVASDFDRWFLNLFPHASGRRFEYNAGGYTTLNFIPSMATMIFGLLAGEWLRCDRSARDKTLLLLLAGTLALVAGSALERVCPLVKRIWTPSWAIFSSGWALIILAGFHGVIDQARWRRWAFPLVVVGSNSIAMYLMSQLMRPFVRSTLQTHIGPIWRAVARSESAGGWTYRNFGMHLDPVLFRGLYGPIAEHLAILAMLWLICLWLHRQRIFLKI
jgi:heparan-alpha-glucosaminide N-acetyltransferase